MKPIPEEKILYETVVSGGWNFSRIVRRGRTLRITDLEGGGNASALFYNADNYAERYNMGDTMKIQHISSLFKNACIYSDMGRVLMSITDSTSDWHDVICGVTYREDLLQRFGTKTYQDAHNGFYRSGFDSLTVELAKYGMTKRDFTNVVNFFAKTDIDADGNMTFVADASPAGSYVDLRAEMDTLVILDAGMHPLNPSSEYVAKPVGITLYESEPAAADDPCRMLCPENQRGFENSETYYL
ncbi:urea amidolyase associated protein UAAP1 [Pontiella agarivorans]|uniref:Urea carboxylase-associated family protein n=1 Tax=Pontiella agarivorans TaxID=3038953 RepID=A0ABU5MXM9_9BACT|nr:urea amidolyase associated protein UAAP1 [Pontiella agarivorans]MDZ8118953.1 urea carboxylase-associated family protein [Pontiella agarivorans]